MGYGDFERPDIHKRRVDRRSAMIRLATQEDLNRVLKIERLSFEIPWGLISLRKALKEIFLVEDNVAGYLIAECRQRSCYMATIKRLAVHPDLRRIGVGTQLVGTGLAVLLNREIEYVMLNVESSRIPAVRLYTKFGFCITDSSFHNASTAMGIDPEASTFFTMELEMRKRNRFTPHLPLDENRNHHLNAMLPPFIIGGQDGDLPMKLEML